MSETTQTKPRCPATAKDGSPCRGNPTKTGWCPFHDPNRSPIEVRGWQRSGGLAKIPATLPDAPDPVFASPEDAQKYAEETAGLVTRGEVSSDVAGIRLRAVEVWMKIWESLKLRDQLEALEQLAGQKLERRWG